MKLLLLPDMHLTDKPPKKRRDKYVKVQAQKVMQIFDIARGQTCDVILQPGDLFDSHRASDYIKQFYIRVFKRAGGDIFCVFGQHDLRYHTSDIENTPIKVLVEAGVLNLLGGTPFGNHKVSIYGKSLV